MLPQFPSSVDDHSDSPLSDNCYTQPPFASSDPPYPSFSYEPIQDHSDSPSPIDVHEYPYNNPYNFHLRRMSEPAVLAAPNAYQRDDNYMSNPYNTRFTPSLHRGSSIGSLRDYRSPPPLSPYQPNFSGMPLSESSPTLPNGLPYTDNYGVSPPGTGTSTSSNARGREDVPATVNDASSADPRSPTDPNNSKTYSFVALPGNAVKKRPRRRYDEIERLYQCSWPDCTKAYGTLNHLNAHVTMQKHGVKRSPNEFKEMRKQWRKQKKEQEAAIAAGQAGLGRRASMGSLSGEDLYNQRFPYSPTSSIPIGNRYPGDDHLSDEYSRPRYDSSWGYPSARSSLPHSGYISSSLPTQSTSYSHHTHHHSHSLHQLENHAAESSTTSYSDRNLLPQNSSLFTPLPGFGGDSNRDSSSLPGLNSLTSLPSLPPLQTGNHSHMSMSSSMGHAGPGTMGGMTYETESYYDGRGR